MKKLTNAQQAIIDKAINEINKARECETFEEYFMKYHAPHFNSDYNTPEKYITRNAKGYKEYKKYWEDKKSGIVLTYANSRTILALEKAGYIEIIHEGRSDLDTIKVLNY